MATLQAFISKHEGYVDHVYVDSLNHLTGGIGHRITEGNYHVHDKISAEQIAEWFKEDVSRAIAGAKQDLGPAYDRLNEARKIVVIDMVFNLGASGFAGFHDTIHAIRFGAYSQAAHHMLQSDWAGQVGGRANEDAAIMRSGHLSGGGEDRDRGHGEDNRGHGHGGGPTGGLAPPSGDTHDEGTNGGVSAPSHGKWSPAPSLGEVKSGSAPLHEGERGVAVKEVQRLLAIPIDGMFGPATRAAVIDFQREHHQKRQDGVVDAHTLSLLIKHPNGGVKGESRRGAAQRVKMLGIARSGSQGQSPDGRCYYHVCQFLIQCGGYGKITNPYEQFPSEYLPEAHNFADLMNSRGPEYYGLERLSISTPYNAPAGSIVVVKAGSPGTSDPTAGDIAIANGHDKFFNGGEMQYGGPEGWEESRRAHLLGCYVPL